MDKQGLDMSYKGKLPESSCYKGKCQICGEQYRVLKLGSRDFLFTDDLKRVFHLTCVKKAVATIEF